MLVQCCLIVVCCLLFVVFALAIALAPAPLAAAAPALALSAPALLLLLHNQLSRHKVPNDPGPQPLVGVASLQLADHHCVQETA